MNGQAITPWSAARESALRLQCTVAEATMITAAIMVCVGAAFLNSTVVLTAIIAGFMAWGFQSFTVQRLENIMHNRPGNSRGFAKPQTEWEPHPAGTYSFLCKCGVENTFTGKPLMPNSVDPNGGRYVVHCRCGIGHYKIAGPVSRARTANLSVQ